MTPRLAQRIPAVLLAWALTGSAAAGPDGASGKSSAPDKLVEEEKTASSEDPGVFSGAVLEARPLDPELLPAVEPAPRGRDYVIGRQDLIELRVFDLEELNYTVRVSDDGSITLPLLGRLEVAGLTKSQMEDRIAELLERDYVQDPQVTVFVQEYESKKVAVSGAVKRPDRYAMLGRKTLLEMISMAGGLGEDPGRQIMVFRRQGEEQSVIAVDRQRLVHEGDASLNLEIRPGDIIYVPVAEKLRVFVSGAVNSPGVFEVPKTEPVTVLKAVTLAGGTTDRAAERKVTVVRTTSTGERLTIPVDLRRIKQGKDEDPLLRSGDLVLVKESFF